MIYLNKVKMYLVRLWWGASDEKQMENVEGMVS